MATTSRGVAAVLCLCGAAMHADLAARAPSARDLAERAAAYVRGLDEQLVSIVGREHHEQHVVETDSTSAREERRVLEACIAWVHLAALHDTLAVREVVSVDGSPALNASRLERMLREPSDVLTAAVRELLDESAAHNLAPGTRNINFPTFALAYLRPENVRRSKWKLVRRDGHLMVLAFEERQRPALVRSVTGGHLWGRGSVWVDAPSGRVERIEVSLGGQATMPAESGPGGRDTRVEMRYRQEVSFARDERLDLWLPQRMDDVYEGTRDRHDIRVQGSAVYSEYKRYQTEGRLIPDN